MKKTIGSTAGYDQWPFQWLPAVHPTALKQQLLKRKLPVLQQRLNLLRQKLNPLKQKPPLR